VHHRMIVYGTRPPSLEMAVGRVDGSLLDDADASGETTNKKSITGVASANCHCIVYIENVNGSTQSMPWRASIKGSWNHCSLRTPWAAAASRWLVLRLASVREAGRVCPYGAQEQATLLVSGFETLNVCKIMSVPLHKKTLLAHGLPSNDWFCLPVHLAMSMLISETKTS
jgi:hypothetical protein